MSFELSQAIALGFGKARKASNGYICECPTCQNTLAVTDDGKKVSLFCAKGCDTEIIYKIAESTGLINVPKITAPLQRLTGSEWLAQEIVPQVPIIQNLFDTGDKVVIIGQSKTRKSFFTQQLAFCLAGERRFLNFGDTTRRKVLLVQFEIKQERYHARCKRMMEKLILQPTELENLAVLNARGANEDLQELIKRHVEEFKPEVIIIDPLYKLITGDEAKSEDIKPILSFFDRLAESSKAAVIYVHHDKKGVAGDQQLTDRGSGSGVLARDFDSAIFLSPHKDIENTLVVEFIARNYPPLKAITVDWNDGHFVMSDAAPDKKTARSMSQKKVKNSEMVEKAKEFIKTELRFGKNIYPMSIFNAKLEDVGVLTRAIPGVKDQLIADGLIEITTQKAEQGKSSKLVHFLNVSVAPVPLVESEFKSSFENEADDMF